MLGSTQRHETSTIRPRSGHRVASISLTLLALCTLGCGPSPQFAEWTLPVPDDTRVVGYAPIPMEERTEAVELIAQEVIGDRAETEEALLYRPFGLAADGAGRVFVIDGGDDAVKMFGGDGSYWGSFGGEGQGPGELQFPRSIAVVGDTVVVSDQTRGRLIRWTTTGEFIDEIPVEFTDGLLPLVGQSDGSFVIGFDVQSGDWPLVRSFGRISADADLETPYFEVESQVPMYRHDRGWQALSLPATRPHLVATPGGEVYVTRGDEYQILALTAAGDQRWALRVAAPRDPYEEDSVREAIDDLREMSPAISRDNIDLPPGLPALADIAVDSHGHLHVLPYVGGEATGDRPLDVYSSDGEVLFRGLLRRDLSSFPGVSASMLWNATNSESTYSFGSTDEGETVVVRYRMIEPFDATERQ